jgi:hypothetical protein
MISSESNSRPIVELLMAIDRMQPDVDSLTEGVALADALADIVRTGQIHKDRHEDLLSASRWVLERLVEQGEELTSRWREARALAFAQAFPGEGAS